MDAETKVVAVASGKGGVGKSTVALNLALAAAGLGRRVGLLDADLYGPNIPLMLGVTRRKPARWVDLARAGDAPLEQPFFFDGVRVMSAQFLVSEEQAVAFETPIAEMMLKRMVSGIDWGDIELLVVDLPPGTADLQQRLAAQVPLAGAVIVVTPQDAAHLDAKKVVAMLRQQRVPILGAVENMAGLDCPSCGHHLDVLPVVDDDRSIWAAGVPRLGSLPLDPAIAAASESGRPDPTPFVELARVVLSKVGL